MPPKGSKSSWLTSAKSKSLGAVIASATSSIVAIFTAVRTPSTESTAKAYDLLRQEVIAQREDVKQLEKKSAETQAWIDQWKRLEMAKAMGNVGDQEKIISEALRADAGAPKSSIMFSIPGSAVGEVQVVPGKPRAVSSHPVLPESKSLF